MIIGKILIKSQIMSKTPLSSSFSPLSFRKSCVLRIVYKRVCTLFLSKNIKKNRFKINRKVHIKIDVIIVVSVIPAL